MSRYLIVCATGFLCLLCSMNCSDDPGLIGKGLVPPEDALRIDSVQFEATSDTTYLRRISGNSAILLLGRDAHFEARTLFRLSGISSIPSGVTVDSASLVLPLQYFSKTTSEFLSFEIHEMLQAWNPGTFTWDSLNSGSFSDSIAGSVSQFVGFQDSLLIVRLDKLVQKWYLAGGNPQYGIILNPASTSNIVIGVQNFVNTSLQPRLNISYHDTTDSTITGGFTPPQSTFVANGDAHPPVDQVYVEGGVAYRALVRFDSLRLGRDVSITSATLEVVGDAGSSLLNKYSRDSLIVYLSRDIAPPYNSLALGQLCVPTLTGTQKVYRSDVKEIVQQWVTGTPNVGLVLTSVGEYTTSDRFAIYGALATGGLRPRMKIVYTTLP